MGEGAIAVSVYHTPLELVLGKGEHSAHGGDHLLHIVIEHLGLMEEANRLLGGPSSNRGHSNAELLRTVIHMLHIGVERVWDVSLLEDDFLASDPTSRQALERLLLRVSDRYPQVERLMDVVAERCMCDVSLPGPGKRPGRMVDIDEQEFSCGKGYPEMTRKGELGMTQTLWCSTPRGGRGWRAAWIRATAFRGPAAATC